MRNDTHFQFLTEVKDLISAAGPDTLKIGPQFKTFQRAYDRVDEALKIIRRSEHTADIKKADEARDDI